jgi:hypothetical protein
MNPPIDASGELRTLTTLDSVVTNEPGFARRASLHHFAGISRENETHSPRRINVMASPTENATDENCQPNQPFCGVVPDFVLADWFRAMPRLGQRDQQGQRRRGRSRIGGGFHWAIHQAVIAQRSAQVIVPDVLLGQVFWGGNKECWPANWRNNILTRLQELCPTAFTEVSEIQNCPDQCPLSGTTIRHRHFSVLISTEDDITDSDKLDDDDQPSEDAWLSNVFLGVLELYRLPGGERTYDFSLRTQRNGLEGEAFKALSSRLRGFKNKGRLVSVYLPIRMFGGSPRLGLTFRQRQLMLAIHRELTRDRKSKRADKAAIIEPGRLAGGKSQFVVVHYPGLLAGTEYVGFNGNGGRGKERLHDRGYSLMGAYGWLHRARYVYTENTEGAWAEVREFFKDLQVVGEMFGLLVAARHPSTEEWLGLADLPERLRTNAGRKWLARCRVRIYTEQDYLARWRKTIAERMGFSSIPDQDQERAIASRPWQSAVQLAAYLRASGISRMKVAADLSISQSQLSQYMSGKKSWTEGWQGRIQMWVEARERPNRA